MLIVIAAQRALAKLKSDLAELEDYIPWNAVVPSWGNRRAAWARKVRDCPDVQAVAKQLQALEQALHAHSFEESWRGSSRAGSVRSSLGSAAAGGALGKPSDTGGPGWPTRSRNPLDSFRAARARSPG